MPIHKDNIEIDLATEKPKIAAMNSGPMSEGGVNEVYNGYSSGQKGKKRLRFVDLGGLEELIEELFTKVVAPLRYPQLLSNIGNELPAGMLFHGPPGCGKTTLAHVIANEAGVPFYKISAPELVSGISGNELVLLSIEYFMVFLFSSL
ncbi:hypothetical protein LUZ63_011292 [Rhynchospora breviuscula]|uniref:ATPase AAA-type core domain-containing protein n=1 Tax=Rhynchospora breviuscula TaxID=2022672 RepID=A0A9Q0CJI4_9POAL|nr:hypothetical protein LUZ63_011292 [Rhynchospora breviuscula]